MSGIKNSKHETMFNTSSGVLTHFLRVIVGYDDLVYTTSTGNSIILQHGQSWTFECQYKLNSEENINMATFGEPEKNDTIEDILEIQFDMTFYTDNSYNEVKK